LIAFICSIVLSLPLSTRDGVCQAGALRDGGVTRAAASDAEYLRRAQAPSAERETMWMSATWKDRSPHRISFVEANGQGLQVADWGGQGRPLVLLPGMSHTAHVFDSFAPRFTDRFHVLALTLRGHGASSAPAHPYTVDSLAADVHGVLDALKLKDVVLVGHSLGGHVANRVAALYPTLVARVVYLDAAKDSTGLAAVRAKAPTTRPKIAGVARSTRVRAHDLQRRLYFSFWSDAQEADFRAAATAPEITTMADLFALQNWRSVRQPQLAICALDTSDVQFPWLDVRERLALRDRIKHYVAEQFVPWERAGCERFAREASNGSLVVIPESNHYVFLVSPEQTYIAVRRWLESVDEEAPLASPARLQRNER
jgi:pimeloyl-ACP methyl ester carboxylesterase